MKKYRYILFDLDHTLWDFNKNSEETLYQLYDVYHLGNTVQFGRELFVEKFREVNNRLWDLYDRDAIDKLKLRTERFRIIFNELNSENNETADKIGDDYLRICPEKIHLIPHTGEVLDYLHKRYRLYVLTNGFSETQFKKMAFSKLEKYFVRMITSEEAGHKKPKPEFFEYAFRVVGAGKEECIMVGDNLETDIKGAIGAGLDIIFYNPQKIPHTEKVTHEITSLLELKDLL